MRRTHPEPNSDAISYNAETATPAPCMFEMPTSSVLCCTGAHVPAGSALLSPPVVAVASIAAVPDGLHILLAAGALVMLASLWSSFRSARPGKDASDADPASEDALEDASEPAPEGTPAHAASASASPVPSEMLNYVPYGLLVLDNAYHVLHFNRPVHDFFPDAVITEGEPLPAVLAERLPAAGDRTFFAWPPDSGTTLQLDLQSVHDDSEVGWVLSLRDVSDLMRTEQALHDTNSLLQAILDTSVTAVAVVDESGRVTFANRRAENILGLRRRDDALWTYDQLGWVLRPDDPTEEAQPTDPLQAVLNTGKPIRGMRYTITWPDGTCKHLSLHAALLPQSRSGREVVFSVEDVTASHRMQQRLLREQHFSEAAINSLPGIFYMIDADGRHRRWNRTFERVTGYTSEELQGQALHDLFDPGDRTLVRTNVRNALPDGTGFSLEATLVAKDGTRTPYVFTGATVAIDGRDYLIGVGLDVTEQKKRERTLQEATHAAQAARAEAERMNELKSAFLANMSHEIRTPLTSIIGFADVLVAEDDPPSSFPEHIASGGRRLMETLDAILELSKLETEERTLTRSRVRANEPVRAALNAVWADVERKNLQVDVALPPASPTVRLDAVAFRRVARSLLSNAVKFTQPGDSVAVHLHTTALGLRLVVADTGVGIPSDFVSHIFEPFTQASSGLAREHEGSGLGLTVAQGLVDLMNGGITVHSVPGGGTALVVDIPDCVVAPDLA